MQKKRKRLVLYIMGFMALLPVLCLLARPLLVVDESPKKADVMIVLSGDVGRLEKAADLYKDGYAKYVILSKANTKGAYIQDAIKLGIPQDKLILEEKATSTYENALYSKSLMEQHGFNTALVISSDYHMRRTQLTFNKVFKKTDFKITYVASKRNNQFWLSDNKNIKYSMREYIKLMFYLFKY